MKIICKWVFLDLENPKMMKGKLKTGIENMSGDEIVNMITTLLAQPETIRIIFEKDERKNDL